MAGNSIVDIARRIRKVQKATEVSAVARQRAKATGKSKVARPKPLKPKKGISLEKLLFSTPDNIKRNAKRDRVTIVSFRKSKNGFKIFSRSLTYDMTGPKMQVRPHKHWVETDEEGPFYKAKKIRVNCDCEHFMFTYEYALNHHGASWIKHSNGEFPIVTNPRLRPGLCKHLYVLLRYIKANRQ